MASTRNAPKAKTDWGMFFGGVLVALLGFIVLLWPGLTLVTLSCIAGIALIVAAIFEFITWIRTHNTPQQASGWTLLTAACNLLLGALFLIHPIIAAGVLTFFMGCLVVVYGVFALTSCIALRNGGVVWWVMLLNAIISILCGFMFMFYPDTFVIFLGVFLLMRGVTISSYSIIAPGSVGYL